MPAPEATRCFITPGENPRFVDYKFAAGWEGRLVHAKGEIQYKNGSNTIVELKSKEILKEFFRHWISNPEATPSNDATPSADERRRIMADKRQRDIVETANADRQYIKEQLQTAIDRTFRRVEYDLFFPEDIIAAKMYLINIWKKEFNTILETENSRITVEQTRLQK